MGTERLSDGVTQGKTSSREAWIGRGAPLIRTAVEKGIVATDMDFPEGFSEEFYEAVSERNERGGRKYAIFVVSRHNSHPDGFIIARLALDLKAKANKVLPPEDYTKGFIMPLAQSLEEGHQDRSMMRVYHEIKPTMRSFGLVPAPIVREKDRQVYGMEKDTESDSRMRALLAEGYNGVVLFPEGTTTGGKTDEHGKLIGMVPFETNSIKRTHLFLKRNLGAESLIIPAATFGGRELLNPDNKWVSPVRLLTAFASPYPTIARIKVGMPIRSDEGEVAELLRGKDRDALNEHLGRIVAKLVPPAEQGVYAELFEAA